MFQFEYKMAQALSFRSLKAALPGAVLALGLAFAPAAHATTYVLQNGQLEGSRTLNIAGIGNARATAMQFDGYIDNPSAPDTPFTNLVAFCVDVYHRISTGDYNPDLTYTDDIPLTHDSNWRDADRQTLTNQQITHISRLVNYGTNVFYNESVNSVRRNELAAVQGAIWEVVSGRNVTWVSGGNGATINTRINALTGAGYVAAFNPLYGQVGNNIKFITPFKGGKVYPHRDLTQAFAIASIGGAAIPEPATWALMIGGFALAGGVLRVQRRKTAPARI